MFRFFSKPKNLPPFLEEYERLCAIKVRPTTPVEELKFIVFDTETTGLDLTRAKMLSFGGIAVSDRTVDLADSLEIIFQQPGISVKETADIHGILRSHAEKGVSSLEALRQIIEFIGNAILVAHHVEFDRKILEKTLQQEFPAAKLKNKLIDTAELALRLEHFNDDYVYKTGDYTLDALCQRYHLAPDDRHTAAGDAFITSKLFVKLLGRCKARKIFSFKDLVKKRGFFE